MTDNDSANRRAQKNEMKHKAYSRKSPTSAKQCAEQKTFSSIRSQEIEAYMTSGDACNTMCSDYLKLIECRI